MTSQSPCLPRCWRTKSWALCVSGAGADWFARGDRGAGEGAAGGDGEAARGIYQALGCSGAKAAAEEIRKSALDDG